MHFSNVLTLALAACVAAAPQGPCPGAIGGCLTIRANGPPGLLGGGSAGTGSIGALSPIPAGTTTASAIASCGDNTQLSCCNKADTSGSSANVASGILSGLLPNLVGGGQDGLGLFDQCSKISVTGRKLLLWDNLTDVLMRDSYWCCGPPQFPVQADRCLLPEQSFNSGIFTVLIHSSARANEL